LHLFQPGGTPPPFLHPRAPPRNPSCPAPASPQPLEGFLVPANGPAHRSWARPHPPAPPWPGGPPSPEGVLVLVIGHADHPVAPHVVNDRRRRPQEDNLHDSVVTGAGEGRRERGRGSAGVGEGGLVVRVCSRLLRRPPLSRGSKRLRRHRGLCCGCHSTGHVTCWRAGVRHCSSMLQRARRSCLSALSWLPRCHRIARQPASDLREPQSWIPYCHSQRHEIGEQVQVARDEHQQVQLLRFQRDACGCGSGPDQVSGPRASTYRPLRARAAHLCTSWSP
jgi:hypothetical protein